MTQGLLWLVKPGRVLISLSHSSPLASQKKKSTRESPMAPTASQASIAMARQRSATASGTSAGITVWLLPSLYLVS